MIQFELPDGRHQYWYDAAEVAKHLMIKDDKKILGRNKFMQYCRHNGVLCKDSNQPKQNLIQLGLMRWHNTNKNWKTFGMPLWSDKGIAYMERRISSGAFSTGYLKRIEKYSVNIDDVC